MVKRREKRESDARAVRLRRQDSVFRENEKKKDTRAN